MAEGAFVSVDIGKISKFMSESAEVIKEGADAYKTETDHILENIGGIKDVLDGINNGAVKSLKDEYTKLDDELAEFNKNPQSGGNQGG